MASLPHVVCTYCGSEWFRQEESEDEPCPYCGAAAGHIRPARSGLHIRQRCGSGSIVTDGNFVVWDGESRRAAFAMESDADDFIAYVAEDEVEDPGVHFMLETKPDKKGMGISEALEHLAHLVDVAEPEDTHYYRAVEAVADYIADADARAAKGERHVSDAVDVTERRG